MAKSWKFGVLLLPKCYPWFVFLFCWREWDFLTQFWLLEIAENGAGAVVYSRLGTCLARIWPWLDPQHPMWSPKPAGMIPVHRDKSKSWALPVWSKNTTNKTEIAEITGYRENHGHKFKPLVFQCAYYPVSAVTSAENHFQLLHRSLSVSTTSKDIARQYCNQ